MRYAIPLLGDRIAPRSTCADAVLIVVRRRHRASTEATVELTEHGLLDLAKVLSERRIDVLVCGGISRQEREFLAARRVEVIDNVIGSVDELLGALGDDRLHRGFGLEGFRGHSAASNAASGGQ